MSRKNSGRYPKPTELHKLHGTYRKDRHGDREKAESQYDGQPTKPRAIGSQELKEWQRIVDTLPSVVLASADTIHLEIAARWLVRHNELMVQVQEQKHDDELCDALERRALRAWAQVDRILARFGMTPADRARIKTANTDSPNNALADLGIVG